MIKQAAAAIAILVAGCATLPDADVAPGGSMVAIGEPVHNGSAVVTALEVGEDSRCPSNVQCVWAGRLVLLVEVRQKDRTETGWITLGEGTLFSTDTPGAYYAVTLDEALPTKTAEANIAPAEYRFRFGT